MPDILTFLLLVLAVARLTKLVTDDKIGLPLRQWVLKRSGDNGWLTFGIHCPWCVGMWFAMGAAPLWYYFGHNPIFVIICVALALSYGVGLLAKLEN